MKRSQSGFTMIELVVVIVILGILAATALPRFMNLGADARVSVMKGAAGSLRAANAMIYARAATLGQMGAAATITIEGTPVTLRFGYAVSMTELLKMVDIDTNVDGTPTTGDFLVAGANLQHRKARTPASCSVSYTPATVTSSPVYTETNISNPATAATNCA